MGFSTPEGTLAARSANGEFMPVQLVGAQKRTYLTPETVAVDGTPDPTVLTVPSAPNGEDVLADVYCKGSADTDAVEYWHGADPTTTAGKLLKDHEELASADPASLKFTANAGTCSLLVEYYYYANPA